MSVDASTGLSLEEAARLPGASQRGDASRVATRVQTLDEAAADTITFLANSRCRDPLAGTGILSVDCAAVVASSPIEDLIRDRRRRGSFGTQRGRWPRAPLGGTVSFDRSTGTGSLPEHSPCDEAHSLAQELCAPTAAR